MADRSQRRLRLAALGALLLAFVAMLAANLRVRGAALPRAAWTPAVMLAGFRSLPPAGPPAVTGIVERYEDGAIVVPTVGGPRRIRVDGATAVARSGGSATLADVRPGATIAVWAHPPWWGGDPQARALMVLAD